MDVEQNPIDNNICLVCLNETSVMHSLSEMFDEFLDLKGVLKICLQCEINKPYFPTKLCEHCTSLVKEFFTFKMNFVNSEAILGNNYGVKIEVNNEEMNLDFMNLENVESYEEEIIFEVVNDEFDEDIKEEKVSEDSKDDNQNLVPQITEEMKDPHKFKFDRDGVPDEESNFSKEPTKFKCSVCRKYFIDQLTLKAHFPIHKKHKCEICGLLFAKKSYVTDHMVRHKTTRDFTCPICTKSFKSRHTLRTHIIIHTNPKSFVCEICGSSFNYRKSLQTHLRIKHSQIRDHLCIWCGTKFNLKSSLNKHVLRKHSSKENRARFKCSECNGEYLDKSTLYRHYRIKHSPTYKLMACDLCNKKFSCKSNLLKHNRMKHTEEMTIIKEEVKEENPWSPKVIIEEYSLDS